MGFLSSSHIPVTMYTVGSQPVVTIQLGCQGLMIWVSISSEPKWPLPASWPDEEGDRRDLVFQEKEDLREGLQQLNYWEKHSSLVPSQAIV